MICFELPERIRAARAMVHNLAVHNVRPLSRKYDDEKAGKPWDFINMMFQLSKGMGVGGVAGGTGSKEGAATRALLGAVLAEEMCWGDAALALCVPGPGLGGAAIAATGTEEQKARFLKRFSESDKPVWGAMAITEPGAGSDTAAITTTARRENDHWVLNGEKIFVTSGKMALEGSDGLVVVWATVDKSKGRAGIKPFVVEAGTPGVKVVKTEKKMGIRASDTAAIIFDNCKIPLTNILGSPEVVDKENSKGFKGVMATFDSTRPLVAAMAVGVSRAALDLLREIVESKEIVVTQGLAPPRQSRLAEEILWMERQVAAARWLTWRACSLIDEGRPNNLEASMAKAKAGLVVTQVTQKVVELLGPPGYSEKYLAEKWMRDAKINDIYEGTGQIQMLITARRILGFSREQLK